MIAQAATVTERAGEITKFWDLVENMPNCMMTTQDGDFLRSRPMLGSAKRDDEEFRFITRMSSHKAQEIGKERDVNLSFVDESGRTYISVSGKATLSQDRELIREIWGLGDQAWFNSPNDDDVGLIRVRPVRAEWWDRDTSAAKMAWELLKASVSSVQPDVGENRKISF